MFKRYPLWLFLAAVTVMAACSVSQAATMPLSDLLVEGATFTSGDKIFSNFDYQKTGDTPAAENVNVIDITGPDGSHGIRFQGGFVDQAGGDASDALITFDVMVAMGSPMEISEVRLAANPAVFGGTGMASVTETLLPDIVNDKLVMYDFGNGDDQLADTIVLPQTYKSLSIQKDIILHSTGDTGAVTLSFVDQTFKQVPEPASLGLLAVGMMAVGFFRRRRG